MKVLKLLLINFLFVFPSYTQVVILGSKSEKIPPLYYNTVDGAENPELNITSSETKLNIKYPILLFTADQSQVPFFVYPNDTIQFYYNEKRLQCKSLTSNTRTNELNFLSIACLKFGGLIDYDKLNTYNSLQKKVRDSLLKVKYLQFIAFLEQYKKDNSISENYYTKVQEILYDCYTRNIVILDYNNRSKEMLFNSIEYYLNTIPQSNTSLYYSQFYRQKLVYLNLLLTNKLLNNSKPSLLQKYEVAKKYFSFDNKDYLLYIILKKGDKTDVSYSKLIANSASEIKNEYFITNLMQDFKMQSNNKGDLIDLNSNSILLKSVFQKFNNSFLYVDLWASWCSPCMDEMKHYKELTTYFNNKAITFLFISLDESFTYWKQATKSFSFLTEIKKSYLLKNNFKSQFSKDFNIVSIPRYMIINKKGKVINDNAPRPSDPALIPLLNKLIKD